MDLQGDTGWAVVVKIKTQRHLILVANWHVINNVGPKRVSYKLFICFVYINHAIILNSRLEDLLLLLSISMNQGHFKFEFVTMLSEVT